MTPLSPPPDHPEPFVLRGFLRHLDRDENHLLLHLLACPSCAGSAAAELESRRDRPAQPPGALALDYHEIWPRLEDWAQRRAAGVEAARAEASALVAELLSLGEERREERARTDPRFGEPTGVEALARAGIAARPADPAAARGLLLLALDLAERLPESGCPPELARQLVATLYCELGETRRLEGSLSAADDSFQAAADHLASTLAPDARARFCELLARLRADQGREDEAVALYGRAASLFGELGARASQAECLLERGFLCLRMLDPIRSLGAFERATLAAEEAGMERLAVRAACGGAFALLLQGYPAEAGECLARAEARYGDLSPVERLSAVRVHAQIALVSGDLAGAADLLRSIWQSLRASGELHAAAVAALDLARILLLEGRAGGELIRLAREVEPLARAAGLPSGVREALAAFRRGALAGTLASWEVEHLLQYLERACHNPTLPFEPLAAAGAASSGDRRDGRRGAPD